MLFDFKLKSKKNKTYLAAVFLFLKDGDTHVFEHRQYIGANEVCHK